MIALDRRLTAVDVQRLYSLRDARAARRIIREAGGIKVAGQWVVAPERIIAWEQRAMHSTDPDPPHGVSINDERRPKRRRPKAEALTADWWKE